MTTRRTAGLALAAYPLLTVVVFASSGTPGGDFEPDKITAYLAADHTRGLVLGWLGLALALALLAVGRHVREVVGGPAGDLASGLAVAGTAAGVVGATANTGLAIALVEGGAAVTSGLPLPVAYTMGEVANLLAVCAPAFALGALALVMARRYPMPGWLRAVTVLGALGALTTPLFFTMVPYVVWSLVLGGWLALRPGPAAEPRPVVTTGVAAGV